METAPGLWSLAVVFTVTNLLEHAVMAGLAFRFLPGLRLSRRLVDRGTLREVKGYSVDAFLAMLAGRITVQTGAIVVGRVPDGRRRPTHYAIAARLVDMAKNLLRSATTTLTPAVSERGGDAATSTACAGVLLDGDAVGAVSRAADPPRDAVLRPAVPGALGWRPAIRASRCFPAVAILSATLTIGVAQSVASRILYGMGKLRLFARLALVEAALNLVLSWCWSGRWAGRRRGRGGGAERAVLPVRDRHACSVLDVSARMLRICDGCGLRRRVWLRWRSG